MQILRYEISSFLNGVIPQFELRRSRYSFLGNELSFSGKKHSEVFTGTAERVLPVFVLSPTPGCYLSFKYSLIVDQKHLTSALQFPQVTIDTTESSLKLNHLFHGLHLSPVLQFVVLISFQLAGQNVYIVIRFSTL